MRAIATKALGFLLWVVFAAFPMGCGDSDGSRRETVVGGEHGVVVEHGGGEGTNVKVGGNRGVVVDHGGGQGTDVKVGGDKGVVVEH